MSQSPRQSYVDSGIDWLGPVPTDWRVMPLRAIARPGRDSFIDGDWIESPYITDGGIRLVQTGNIGVGHYVEQGFRYVSESTFNELRCTAVNPGDVLICRLAEPVGRACLAPDLSPMITSVDVCILKTGDAAVPKFLVYFLSSHQYLGYMESQCRGGTRDRVTRSFLGSVRIAVPPVEEQRNIVLFLDHETAKIDALVAEQEKLIELLKEKRQATISHAVTKGLNPNVPMKDSGIEWFGEIPVHWDLRRLKLLFRFSKRQENAEAPVLSVYRDFGVIEKDSRDDNFNKTPEDLSLYQTVDTGDLVVNKMKAWQGSLGISPCRGITSPDYAVFRPLHSESERFLHYLLRSECMPPVYKMISNGIRPSQWRLEPDKFIQLAIPVPPPDEQREIVRELDEKLCAYERLISETERSVALLHEHRFALISAAVTGKIDVRGLVTSEPERKLLESA